MELLCVWVLFGCNLVEGMRDNRRTISSKKINMKLGKMNVYSFVSRWNRFELLIATFRLQYCWSSSGDEVDCLGVAICSMFVRCYWRFSILIIIPTIRCCSLTGPLYGWSAVVLFDRRYPSFRNFDSNISIDVIRMKSYMDSLFDPTWYKQ